MNAKSDELINELISASIAFGREKEPDWQTRIETARCALKAHIDELEGFIDQLIEAGSEMRFACLSILGLWESELITWDDLIKDWNERER